MKTNYWPDEYVRKKRTAEEAVSLLKSGRRIFIGSSCGEPQHLVDTLVNKADHFSDLEIVRLMGLENSPITRLANQNQLNSFHIRNIYHGSGNARHLEPSRPFITPIY